MKFKNKIRNHIVFTGMLYIKDIHRDLVEYKNGKCYLHAVITYHKSNRELFIFQTKALPIDATADYARRSSPNTGSIGRMYLKADHNRNDWFFNRKKYMTRIRINLNNIQPLTGKVKVELIVDEFQNNYGANAYMKHYKGAVNNVGVKKYIGQTKFGNPSKSVHGVFKSDVNATDHFKERLAERLELGFPEFKKCVGEIRIQDLIKTTKQDIFKIDFEAISARGIVERRLNSDKEFEYFLVTIYKN